jgi:hypothetical protein
MPELGQGVEDQPDDRLDLIIRFRPEPIVGRARGAWISGSSRRYTVLTSHVLWLESKLVHTQVSMSRTASDGNDFGEEFGLDARRNYRERTRKNDQAPHETDEP